MASPTVRNSLPDNQRDPDVSIDNFKRLMESFCFQRTSATSALDALRRCAPKNYISLTYLLTPISLTATPGPRWDSSPQVSGKISEIVENDRHCEQSAGVWVGVFIHPYFRPRR